MMVIKKVVKVISNLCISLFTCFIYSQELKLEFLSNDKINFGGTALTYYINNSDGNQLVLKDLVNKKEYRMKDIHKETVLSDDFFIGLNIKTHTLYKIDLKSQLIDSISGVDNFKWLEENKILLYYQKQYTTIKALNLNKHSLKSFCNIKKYALNERNGSICLLNDFNEIQIYAISSGKKAVFNEIPKNYRIRYVIPNHIDDSFFSFFINDKTLKVYKSDFNSNKLVFSQPLTNVDTNSMIDTLFQDVRLIDSNRIALGVKTINRNEKATSSEIWLGSTKELPTALGQRKESAKLAILDIVQQKFLDLSNHVNWDNFKLSNDNRNIYGFYVSEKYNMSRIDPELDVYIYDKKLKNKINLGTFNGTNRNVISSKYSSLLFYFKNNNWHFYDPVQNRSVDITSELDDVFYDKSSEVHKIIDSPLNQYLIPYKNNYFIFNGDKYLWLFDFESRKMVKMIRDQDQKYFLSHVNFTLEKEKWSWSDNARLYNYNNIILTYTTGNHIQGISLLDKKGEIKKLMESSYRIDHLARSQDKITYIKQKANSPPALYLYDIKAQEEQLIFQSNISDTLAKNVKVENYEWFNDRMEYRNLIVTYPKNYDSTKKYPAIFDIYEKKNQIKSLYTSPLMVNGSGINSRYYSDNGYFVIHPSIFYEIGNTGNSASNCVLEALDKVLEILPIDSDRVGLIGHSFGGYETNFILTKTNRFKTAVSSSGVADIVSAYFTFSLEYKISDMFRYETQQFRMGESFFTAQEKYIENSPIFHANNIVTPLLLITGKKDYVVNWIQSITMFLALKRLKKDVSLILYPEEGHVLMNQKNKVDASIKIKSWFDFYLKNGKKPEWLE